MRYRFNSQEWHDYSNMSRVPTLATTGSVIVAVDPGKTNMAVVVGDTFGDILEWIELTGKDCNTTDYCQDVRQFLFKHLQAAHIKAAGIEQAVSYKGMEYYHSQMVLTEIRANLLSFFNDTYGFKPMEINNYSWKSAILPDGYRGTKEKGSKRFLAEKGLIGVTHDVTDCICMYFYLHQRYPDHSELYCNKEEESIFEYDTSIFSPAIDMQQVTTFKFNSQYSLTSNIAFYINKTQCESFRLVVDIDKLSYKDIYGGSCFFNDTDIDTKEVQVVVIRKACLFGRQ